MAVEMAQDGGTFIQAKLHNYNHYKLRPSYNINQIGVISLFIWYWPSPTTIDTISATIVAASGQARFPIKHRGQQK